MNAYAIHEAAAWAFRLIDATNLLIAETTPWTLAKDPAAADRLTQVLFDAAEAIRLAAVLLTPIMPASCTEIRRRVGDGTALKDLRLDRDGTWRGEGVREIVKERPIFLHESRYGLNEGSYFISKFLPLGLLGIVVLIADLCIQRAHQLKMAATPV